MRTGLRGRDHHLSDAGVSSLRFPTSALVLTNLSLYVTLPVFQGRHPYLQATFAHSVFSTVPLLQEFLREGPQGTVPHPPHLCYRMAWCHRGPPPHRLDGVSGPATWLSGCTPAWPRTSPNLVAGNLWSQGRSCTGVQSPPRGLLSLLCCGSPSTAVLTP